ncbi:hypothetical protein E2C01_089950 [Portunus trituberculatus]|uniref:Uncharacterized protein n=1 Tax=Portunus trituberculatus TaxID=210409 RepID=A0A5B7JKM7_PORTR|nr:hypothetical protein [Portunus trituberculatus]
MNVTYIYVFTIKYRVFGAEECERRGASLCPGVITLSPRHKSLYSRPATEVWCLGKVLTQEFMTKFAKITIHEYIGEYRLLIT